MRDTVFAVAGRISETITEYEGLPVFDARKDVTELVDLIIEAVPEWTGQKEWLEQVI